MKDVEIKEYNTSEKSKLIDFLNRVLVHRMLEEDWEWEYEAGGDKFSFVTIQKGNEFLGSQGFIPIEMVINEEVVLTGKSENSFVDSSLRGTGSFEKLYESGIAIASAKGQQYIWGFTALSKVWRNKLGFYVNEDSIYESILTISPFKETGKKFIYYLYQLYRSLKTKFLINSKIHSSSNNFVVEKAPRELEDVENFYGKLDKQYPQLIRLLYSPGYINWRIRAIKAIKYEEIYLYDKNGLAAYAFLNINNSEHLYISDIMFNSNESERELLRQVLFIARKLNAKTLRYFGNHSNPLNLKIFNSFKSLGAKEFSNKSMNFVLKRISNSNIPDDLVFDIKNWFINGLFTEGYRI